MRSLESRESGVECQKNAMLYACLDLVSHVPEGSSFFLFYKPLARTRTGERKISEMKISEAHCLARAMVSYGIVP